MFYPREVFFATARSRKSLPEKEVLRAGGELRPCEFLELLSLGGGSVMLPTTPQPQGTLGLVARRRHFGAFRHPLQHKALRSWQHYRPTTKNPVNPKNGWWVGNVADNAATSTGNR